MSETRKIIRVFLASPGDLALERRATKAAADEINSNFANDIGYQIELVGWEDTLSTIGRPQEIINSELDHCDYFLGLLWRRWGTPTGSYSSGFEEEFDRSFRRYKKEGKPSVSLMFKSIGDDFLRDPGDELKKVISFKQSITSQRTLLYDSFADAPDFEIKIRRYLSKYVTNLWQGEHVQVASADQGRTTDANATSSPANPATTTNPVSDEAISFLRQFADKAKSAAFEPMVDSFEVARLRLISCSVSALGNDKSTIGPHDANILYRVNRELFSRRELNTLLLCSLEHYRSENIPLWRWYVSLRKNVADLLAKLTFIGNSDSQRAAAITAMRLISEELPTRETEFSRVAVLSLWLSENEESRVKEAALKYLADLGGKDDIPFIENEVNRNHYQTLGLGVTAIVRILLRDNREDAIRALYRYPSVSMPATVLDRLFLANSDTLNDAILLEGVDHTSPEIRRRTSAVLVKRRSLPLSVAERLVSDTDAEVRYNALQAQCEVGKTVSLEEAKSVLVKPVRNTALGIGFGAAARVSSEGEACWERYREDWLAALSVEALRAWPDETEIFDGAAFFALARRCGAEQLRMAIDDQFEEWVENRLKVLEERIGGWDSTVVQRTRDMRDFIRRRLTRRGIEILSEIGEARDLNRIRQAVNDDFIEFTDKPFLFLRKFGEWSDIALIMRAVGRLGGGLAIISENDMRFREAARAIYEIGHNRLGELLRLEMSPHLLVSLLIRIADSKYKKLPDDVRKSLFNSENDLVRKVAALKCIRTSAKRVISDTLTEYLELEERYYNVVHWLDMGVSLQRDRALAAAAKALSELGAD